ncbi:trypsin-like peptidase domain-containing protein [Streptomyces lonegramiae]|uniref:Trypsin-like peptidase domain-containing protein n=1 Tax=Streptomyces lonegramiae TaxID=3075524 RepID=A0ABU2XAG1_9ACTN|nr:trypsin-like peptidase domain-containing protein [Streptomyces sp. DSM 41529]MDT0542387.1 trypsin-like peptidase domain-containing protein [Streptomyces sp. DSM 41529]
MAGLDPDRVAEIIVKRGDGRPGERGSGYLVTDRTVLTAAHVVREATAVRLRLRADQPGAWSADGVVVFTAPEIDVAVVSVVDAPDLPPVTPVTFGRIMAADGELPCSMMGFPRFKLREDAPGSGSRFRDAHHQQGTTSPWSNARQKTLSIRVDAPAPDPDPEVSPWEAMSGAAVWSEGHLIGVVIEHHASEGLGRLTASRVDRWHEALSEAESAQLALFTGFPARREGLREVRVPAGRAGQREEAIRALLSAERTDSDVQPYRFLDADAPALERVYVHQRVVEHTEAAAPEPVPAEEILDRHRHVLIEGEAGAGKSTFTQRVARRGAEAPGAREHAVRIPAVDLTGGAPLPVLLRESVQRRLGGHLGTELPCGLFESGGASGDGGWLLLVDGLDEIVDTAARRRVISIVAANVSGPYRWVVTTRFLPAHELAPLRDAGLASYALAPFDESQLRELARRWLDGNAERAEAFLREVERSGLRQLVRTPLVAAITLSIFRRAPGAALPTGRPGLYQECVGYLLSGRPGEEERRAGLLRAVAQAGGSRRLAEWLYGARVPLLTALAHNTLTADAPLLEEALRWIAQQADEATDFLHGWREVVTGLLSGTGLLLYERGSGELHWAHRSFAEYLAAHDTASRLPADWPGAEPLRDELFRAALRGERRDFGVLAIACWAGRAGTDAERLVGWLLRSSDDYDLFGMHRGASFAVVGGDSSVPDDHAALAGRLLAEGVRVPDALTTSVLNRLLERAGSTWNAQEFCALIAAQPMRDVAYQALVAMADNDRLSITARSGAVVALGRIFGFEAALAKAEPLLASRQIEHTTYTSPNFGRVRSGPVSEGRIAAAYYLLALGSRIYGPVRRVLTDVSLPADDDLGRFLLGNCAVALGDTVSLLRLLDLSPDGDRLPNQDDMRLLIQAGAYDTADSMTNALFAMVEDPPPPDSPLWRGEWEYRLGDIVQALCAAAEAYLSAGRNEAAAAVARRILGTPLPSDEMNATPYTVLVRTGVPEPALAALAPGKDGTSPPLWGPYWAEVARTLYGEGYVDEVRNATEARLAHPIPLDEAVEIAKYLVWAGDPRGLEALLTIANHPDTKVSIALRAVQDLLGGEFHAVAVDTLIALSRRPVSGGAGLDIARLLAGAGVEDEASRLALTLVRACMGDPDTWEMAALTEPLRLLSALRPEEGRALLLEAAASPHLPTRDLADLARMLERCGERGDLGDLLRRWSAVATHDYEFTQLGGFLARCGKKGEAAAAYRKALAVRAGDTELRSLYGVREAVDELRSLGAPLTPEDISALRTVYASLAPLDTAFSRHQDVEWLAALLDQLTEGVDEG